MRKKRARKLSHVDACGAARMVDVSAKRVTTRRAVASAEVRLSPGTLPLIHDGKLPKGDVFAVARLAGIQAAKKTAELIPLCHPLPIDAIAVEITPRPPDRNQTGRGRRRTSGGCVRIEATATIKARTGVEMEALTAAAVAALTIYDMCKAVDRGIIIGPIQLEKKSGGRSGTWRRK